MARQQTEASIIVVVDTCVVINLLKANCIHILGQLKGWDFIVPEQVAAEVKYPDQKKMLNQAFDEGYILLTRSYDQEEIKLYAELTRRMGKGEAACLAIAACRKLVLASDDRGKAFMKLVREHIGESNLISTIEIIRLAVEQGILSDSQAAEAEAVTKQ